MNSYASDPEMGPVLQQMAYKSSYTETINKQMRVPETITVAEGDEDTNSDFYRPTIDQPRAAGLNMEVPDKIVVSVGDEGIQYRKGKRDMSDVYSTERTVSPQHLALQTPPRVLTLQDRNLDSLDIDISTNKSDDEENFSGTNALARPTDIAVSSKPVVQKICLNPASACETPSPKSLFENLQVESSRFYREVLARLTNLTQANEKKEERKDIDNRLPSEDLDDVTVLRNEVLNLHKRIAALEQQQANRTRYEYIVYGITVAFWMLNGWFLYSHRRLY